MLIHATPNLVDLKEIFFVFLFRIKREALAVEYVQCGDAGGQHDDARPYYRPLERAWQALPAAARVAPALLA